MARTRLQQAPVRPCNTMTWLELTASLQAPMMRPRKAELRFS